MTAYDYGVIRSHNEGSDVIINFSYNKFKWEKMVNEFFEEDRIYETLSCSN